VVRGDVAPIKGLPHLGGENEAVLPPLRARLVYLSRWLLKAPRAL
jgi:hypothetical protein